MFRNNLRAPDQNDYNERAKLRNHDLPSHSHYLSSCIVNKTHHVVESIICKTTVAAPEKKRVIASSSADQCISG